MKRRWKQFLAGIMTAVMLFGLLPTAAYASIGQLIENGAVQNAALLETLRQMYGEDAEAYLAVLEQYGLVDEDGNLITNEKIVVDGVEYTLAELEAYLAQPGLDLSRIATVDGQPISLEDLQTVLEIEKYLAELKAKYFTPQDLNEDQIASFYDLAGAFANGDVVMLSSNGLTGVGPAGVDHGVRLSVEPGGSPAAGGTYTVTVTASASSVADQPISFSWRAVGGNVRVDDSGSITMYPGESRTLNISVGTVDGYVDGSATFLVQLYGLKNALFSDGSTRWEKTVTVANSEPLKYTEELPFSLTSSAIQEYDYIAKKGEASIADSSSNSDEVVRNQTEVTSHLVDGNYTIGSSKEELESRCGPAHPAETA